MKRALYSTVLLTSVGLLLMAEPGSALSPPESKKEAPESPLKVPSRKEAMQMKLKSAQSILEGIALDDFAKIEAAANEMSNVTRATAFLDIYQGKEYQFHVELMRRPAEMIAKKAKEKNMDGVMVAYQDLTLSCLKCHQAMKEKKFAAME